MTQPDRKVYQQEIGHEDYLMWLTIVKSKVLVLLHTENLYRYYIQWGCPQISSLQLCGNGIFIEEHCLFIIQIISSFFYLLRVLPKRL